MTGRGLVGIGDNVVDLYLERGVFFPGGNALNVAVLARRFGLPASEYIGILGTDREAAHVRASLLGEGLVDDWLREAIGPNGKAQVRHDPNGDRVFVESNRGGIRRKVMLRMDDDDVALIERMGHVHSSCFSYIETELSQIRAVAKSLSYDFSVNREPEYLRRICPMLDIAFLSGQGLDARGVDNLIELALSAGAVQACVTLGADGALWSDGRERRHQPVVPAHVIDTMGAGDAFIAGYLAATIMGRTSADALVRAAECAASCCGWEGSWGHPLPDQPAQRSGLSCQSDPACGGARS